MKTVIISAVTILRYMAVEVMFRSKWLLQDICAFLTGYLTHKNKIQMKLDHNQRGYKGMKQYKDGYYYNGRQHSWDEYPLY